MSIYGPQSAAVANVVAATATTQLFAQTAACNGRTIYNDSSSVLYVKFGATASSSSYTVQLASQDYFEFPQPIYCGEVDGIWVSANGAARVTQW